MKISIQSTDNKHYHITPDLKYLAFAVQFSMAILESFYFIVYFIKNFLNLCLAFSTKAILMSTVKIT